MTVASTKWLPSIRNTACSESENATLPPPFEPDWVSVPGENAMVRDSGRTLYT